MSETVKKPVVAEPQPQAQAAPKTIRIIHQKSPNFPIFHSDGVWGVLTPSGGFHIEFYTEHQPVPTAVVHFLTPDGSLSNEYKAEGTLSSSDQGIIIRDFQAGIVLSVPVAMQLRDLLVRYIDSQTVQAGSLGDLK
jgi:hypothetical protein